MKNSNSNGRTDLREMYALNLITNMNANYAVVNNTDLEKNILRIKDYLKNGKVPGVVGHWEVVWGPAVGNTPETRTYKAPRKEVEKIKRFVTNNAVYVAQKQGTEEYFIGISGTNGISLVGWFDQDFDVSESVAWPPEWLGSFNTKIEGARISKAGETGLKALWNLKPAKGAEQLGITLIDFILKTAKNNCTISIGGHSLGGCLTPIVATAIADRMKDIDQGKQKGKLYENVKINAYPTAGPTPGNQKFADHLQKSVNEYHAVYNTNDLVPLAWDFTGLSKLKNAYSKWRFGMTKIRPNTRLIVNFLGGVSKFPKENQYVQHRKTVNRKFQVTTWANEKIPKLNKNNSPRVGTAVAVLSAMMHHPSIKKELHKIFVYKNEGSSLNLVAVRQLARFLLQVLLQHVSAYSNPTSESRPWSFSSDENDAFSKLFKRPSPSQKEKDASKHWAIATGIVMLSKLAAKAAESLKNNPSLTFDYFEDETESENKEMELENMEMEEFNMEAPESDEEVLAALDILLQESPELLDEFPFMSNPYAQM